MKTLCVFIISFVAVFGYEGTVILPNNMDHKVGLNKFSEMSFEEFSKTYLMVAQNCSATRGNHVMTGNPTPPKHKDWRMDGKFVTKVKNQGKCGSCWSFSTTGCLESATAIHVEGNPLISLSEQQLIDCAQNFNNKGCGGGLPSQAFEYIKYNNGLMKETDYPYLGKNGADCKYEAAKASARVKHVINITMDAENEIVDAVAFRNPVSIAFQVTEDFQHYKSGVFSSEKCGKSPNQVNHAVLAVGYGTDDKGKKYWIVKNSWGSDWGMDGYFMIERGVNMCGLATCASYPAV